MDKHNLQAGENYLRLNEFLDCIKDISYSVDANWRLTFVNRKAEEYFHNRRDRLIGTLLWDLLPGHEASKGYKEHLRAMKERIPVTYETYSYKLSGWIEANIHPISDGGLLVFLSDISEPKRIEETLREGVMWRTFTLSLSDALRPLADPVEIQGAAARVLAEFINTDRAYYVEISEDGCYGLINTDYVRNGASHITGTYNLQEFGSSVEILQNGPFIVADTQTSTLLSAREREAFAAADIGAVASVPLIKDGKKVAYFSVSQPTPRYWTPFEISLLIETAERTWESVERARSRSLLEKDLSDTKLLQSISSELLQQDDIQALYEKIVDTAVQIMHSQFASLRMLLPEQDNDEKLHLLAYRGFNSRAIKYWECVSIYGKSTCSEALRTGRRVVVTDLEKCGFVQGTEDLSIYTENGIRACQATPLYSRSGKLVGMISTHWLEPHNPSERELRLLDLLARQAADLIERKQAEESIVKQNTILQAIKLVYEKTINCANIKELGQTCLDIVQCATGSKLGFLGELGADGLFHNIACSDAVLENIMEADITGRNRHILFGLYNRVLLEGRSLLTNDPASHPDAAGLSGERLHLAAFLGVPFIHGGKAAGMVGVGNREGGYRIEDQEIMEALAPTILEVLIRQKQQEQLLRTEQEKNDILLKSMQMKDEFISNISHDFKTPLTVINSAVQAMRFICRNELSQKANDYLSKILQNSNRQLKLVNNLLDITRINANRIKINRKNIDIVSVTRTIIESIKVFADQKEIRLSFSSALRRKVIGIDEEKYERIILNLLSNAIKFTPKGKSISVRIFRSKSPEKSMVCIQVTDQGIGIPKEKQLVIFERFGQVDSPLSRQAEGTGIGLSLVKMFVELMDGEITVQSREGKGSTFTVLLPASRIKETPAQKQLQELTDNRLIQATAVEFSDIY